MEDDIKPLQRGKELAPLSREHHDGLLFVWKLRRGLQNGTEPVRLKKYIIWYWQNHIKPHFFQEEKILLPILPEDNNLAIRLKNEHENIRELILNLDVEADKNSIALLADLVYDHIRFEERKVFTYLEQSLSKEQLNNIFLQLEVNPIVCNSEWEDQFWVNK